MAATTRPPARPSRASRSDTAGSQVQVALTQVLRWASRRDVRRRLLGPAADDLSQNDVWLLDAIEAGGPVRLSDLAHGQGVDKSTITPQVRRLEERHLVERHPAENDRRAALLTVTGPGHTVQRKMADTGSDLFQAVLHDWSEEDRRTFAALFTRFARELQDAESQTTTEAPHTLH